MHCAVRAVRRAASRGSRTAGMRDRLAGREVRMRTNRSIGVCSIAAAALLAATTAGAQATGWLTGTVHDPAGVKLPGVEVSALGTTTVVRTDTAGDFLLSGLPAGTVSLRFRRIGYEPVVLDARVPLADTSDVEVTLTVVAQQITGMIVQAGAQRFTLLDEFDARRKQGIGYFITRADIVKRHPMLLSDMARMIPGVLLVQSSNGQSVLRFSRSSDRRCPPQYWVDGVMVVDFNIDDMPPADVAGVEFYAGAAGLPPQFNRLMSNAICGTVAIWTRVPGGH